MSGEIYVQDFAALDFPTEFDYLESLADEASEYMTTAVESYHDAYDNGGYNQPVSYTHLTLPTNSRV